VQSGVVRCGPVRLIVMPVPNVPLELVRYTRIGLTGNCWFQDDNCGRTDRTKLISSASADQSTSNTRSAG